MKFEWKEYTVQELIDLGLLEKPIDGNHGEIHPKASDYVDTGIPFIMANNIVNGVIDFVNCVFITEKQANTLKKGFAKPGDVLLTHKATIGRTAIVPDEYKTIILTPQVTYYRVKNGINNYYLKYYFDTPKFQTILNNWAGSGSTRAYLGITAQCKLPIILPSYNEQVKISYILRVLDDKIELNNKINANLEQQAQAIFKSWFVDFEPFDEIMINSPMNYQVPQSLKIVQISEIPHILETGKRPKGGAVSEGILSIGAENVKQLGKVDFSSAKYIPVEFAANMKKGEVHGYEGMNYKDGGKPGTFIPHFSMFGEGFPCDQFFINEHVFKLDFGNHGYNEFCYFYLQTDYAYNWLANNGTKPAVPGINQQDINSIWIPHPNNPQVKKFCEWVQPIFTTILRNCTQNVKLVKLRDTLLPKLMSGEIDVSDITI